LYKKLEFTKVAPFQGEPVVLDDTCYFFPCQSEEECKALHELVQSEPAREFWSAFVFWDAKRPITARILNLLDLAALAHAEGVQSDVVRVVAERQLVRYTEGAHQRLLFRDDSGESLVRPNAGTDDEAAQEQHAANGASRRGSECSPDTAIPRNNGMYS
jgi:hypothetical protein